MFETARSAKTEEARTQAVVSELEGTIRTGAFRLTDVLNADPDLQIIALRYLHGRHEDSRKEPVMVQVEVTERIVKNHALTMRVGGRAQTVGGSEKMAALGDGRALRTVTEPGIHSMTTERATWFLHNYGVGVTKNDLRSEATRRAWCREVKSTALAPKPRAAAAAVG